MAEKRRVPQQPYPVALPLAHRIFFHGFSVVSKAFHALTSREVTSLREVGISPWILELQLIGDKSGWVLGRMSKLRDEWDCCHAGMLFFQSLNAGASVPGGTDR